MKIERAWAMPNKWTFKVKPISKLLQEEMNDKKWIDPFAGKSSPADITNDLNTELDTDYHKEAKEFLKIFDDRSIDGGVLFDPPYSLHQVKQSYDKWGIENWNEFNATGGFEYVKNEINRVTKNGAKVISFGWNSSGMGRGRDFTKDRILLVCHGGNHNDTIVVVETKKQSSLDNFSNFS
jgi:hypothetical protein